jgi:hypothetical protein
MERLVPGASGLVEKIVADAGMGAALGAAVPALKAGVTIYESLGGKPIDANQIAATDHDKSRDMPD